MLIAIISNVIVTCAILVIKNMSQSKTDLVQDEWDIEV